MTLTKSRSKSSGRWLARQMKDVHVKQAKACGYRSRAAIKLIEMQKNYGIFKPGMKVIDLGAAPGSWSQLIATWIGLVLGENRSKLIALDLLPIDPIKNVDIILGDFGDPKIVDLIRSKVKDSDLGVDVIVSDMAPNLSGIWARDLPIIFNLATQVRHLAITLLKKEGSMLIKLFISEELKNFIKDTKKCFRQVTMIKPKASRAESREIYLLAKGLL